MRLPFLLRNRNFYLMLAIDAALVCLAFYLAFSFRFDWAIPLKYKQVMLDVLPILVPLKALVFYWSGLYYGMWRYTSLMDMRNVLVASVMSSLLFLPLLFLLQKSAGFPRTVLVMDLILTFLLIGGVRVGIRVLMGMQHGREKGFFLDSSMRKRMAIIGAGQTGESMVREMLFNPGLNIRPAVLFDDDVSKHGKTVHGCKVAGSIDQLVKNSKLYDEILIALPSVKGERMRQIADLCKKTGKSFRIIPNIGEIMDGQVSVKVTRSLRYEDLLGREEVHLDHGLITSSYAGKKIIVTGCGGSIGSELVRQIGHYNPQELILVDFSEYNLFQIDLQARQLFPEVSIKSYLLDIRDMQSLDRIMGISKPDVVLHAAAYKHVPLQELNPWESVLNNILGTRNMVDMAQKYGVEKFILVSTDKAVRPTNVMGATKRVTEMLAECSNGLGSCRFVAVRFGNVLGSSGSVVPIFERQIASRMPVTVTHPEVTRYFMSVSEAAQLILQAGAMADGGEIFILDMGQPVRIQDMARDLIRMHGLEPDKDVPIEFTGLRPGEKLYEELITEGEGVVDTRHQRIKVIRGGHCDREDLYFRLDQVISSARAFDAVKIKQILKEIVPEYRPEVGDRTSEVGESVRR
jgi:FlaA1/EpsC-like NDP-sugar epimerase